jgi:hypothetical protein
MTSPLTTSVPDPTAALTHGCVRCGAPIALEDGMCERCNPLGLRQPSATQAHGTALIGVAVAVVVLAVAARVLTAGIGPFTARIANVQTAADGLRLTIDLTNKGTTTSAISCTVGDPAIRGIGPETAVVQSPNVPAGQELTFEATVTSLGTDPRPLTIACGE